MLVTAALAAIVGTVLCVAIVAYAARRLRLPIRETLIWCGLAEQDVSALARAAGRRRA
jgi:ABC-type maltose transport system permease subunit